MAKEGKIWNRRAFSEARLKKRGIDSEVDGVGMIIDMGYGCLLWQTCWGEKCWKQLPSPPPEWSGISVGPMGQLGEGLSI